MHGSVEASICFSPPDLPPPHLLPHCLVLMDEIEKTHPDVFDILLQVWNARPGMAATTDPSQLDPFPHPTLRDPPLRRAHSDGFNILLPVRMRRNHGQATPLPASAWAPHLSRRCSRVGMHRHPRPFRHVTLTLASAGGWPARMPLSSYSHSRAFAQLLTCTPPLAPSPHTQVLEDGRLTYNKGQRSSVPLSLSPLCMPNSSPSPFPSSAGA